MFPTNNDTKLNSGDGPKYNEDVEELNSADTGNEDPDEIVEADEEEEEVPAPKPAAKKEEAEEEDEEEAEEEEVVEDDQEDDKKPDIPFDRPSFSEIKAKYPNFFKDFPQMREAFHREVEFTRLFPTVADAREAFEDNEAFVTLREDIVAGKSEPLLEALESQGKDALDRFADGFLGALHKKSPDLFQKTLTPVLEGLCRQMYASSDEDDRNAALRLSNFLFNTIEIAEGKRSFYKKVEPIKNTSDDPAKYQEVLQGVGVKANVALGQLISQGLDPEKTLTPFIRKQIVTETINEIQKQLGADVAHKQIMNARWKRARVNNYSDDDQAKIISTFLARAKSLIPSVRSKIMQDALGTHNSSNKKKIEKIQSGLHKERFNGGGGDRKSTPEKVDYRKMSDLQILEMN